MIERLLERAATRFVFVVGKGGVGKSTSAAAFALALADRSGPVHLISTDPAHSLGDLFQQDLSSGIPTPSRCSPQLELEEFAAAAYAQEFFEELRAPLIELIERGTYLDTTDATSFLDLSIPGIDEVMSALRLVQLHESAAPRVIVDTAPTGHTMRLLEAAHTIHSWVAAGRAMAEKAGTVAAYLVGMRVTVAAEPLLDRLETRASRFDDEVLSQSSAIVVTRAGEVVASETRSLIQYLQQRGIHVAATIGNVGVPATDFIVDTFASPVGCAALRSWREHLHPGRGAPLEVKPARRTSTQTHDAAAWLAGLEQKILFVAGKGGVGKSTCAAAIALALSDRRRVCIVSTDPAGSLAHVFACDVRSDEVQIAPDLFARQVDATGRFERMRAQYRDHVAAVLGRVGLDTSLRLDRNVIESLWNFAPPGIDELISLIEILERADEFDVLVIDSAPTGHFLRLIELPAIALDWVHSLLRILVKYSALGSLDALARDLLGFAKSLRQLQLDLSAPERAAVFVVTLDQPLVAAETARLNSAIARGHLPVGGIIVNRTAGGTPTSHHGRVLVAPEMDTEVVGTEALRAFVAQWELAG